jgi:hypothetical protein
MNTEVNWNQYLIERSNLFEQGPGYGQPEILQTGGSYVLTQETERMIARLPETTVDSRDIDTFNGEIAQAVAQAFTPGSLIVVREQAFYDRLSQELARSVRIARQQKAEVINVDRFIASPYLEVGVEYSTLSIGRLVTPNGEILTSRPTDLPVSSQLEIIRRKMEKRGINNIIIVDDGFASPESLVPYVEIANQMNWNIVGFTVGVCPVDRGAWAETKEIAERITGNPVRMVLPATDIVDWTCQRDFTIFGGKMMGDPKIPMSVPYFYPFSNGTGGSIPPEKLMEFSRSVLEANARFIQAIDKNRTTPLTFADVLAAGYGIPTSTLGAIRTPLPEETVSEFIIEALQTL